MKFLYEPSQLNVALTSVKKSLVHTYFDNIRNTLKGPPITSK